MARIRYRHAEEESSSSGVLLVAVGALAGLAAGVLLAQRFGGLAGLTGRLRDRFETESSGPAVDSDVYDEEDDYEDYEQAGEAVGGAEEEELEERVLEAYRNDPVLSARAVDIGAVGAGIIELTGWVHADDEMSHAVTLARGVPGVETVVNRMVVRGREAQFEDAARRVREGDMALTEARWEGQQVGTGKRRQGTSDEFDRHADPKPELEDRWLSEQEALKHAADDIEAGTGRRRSGRGRTERSGGVPKADHVSPGDNSGQARAD
jgi:hypothetical protein